VSLARGVGASHGSKTSKDRPTILNRENMRFGHACYG
jgi:hypothetical protein